MPLIARAIRFINAIMMRLTGAGRRLAGSFQGLRVKGHSTGTTLRCGTTRRELACSAHISQAHIGKRRVQAAQFLTRALYSIASVFGRAPCGFAVSLSDHRQLAGRQPVAKTGNVNTAQLDSRCSMRPWPAPFSTVHTGGPHRAHARDRPDRLPHHQPAARDGLSAAPAGLARDHWGSRQVPPARPPRSTARGSCETRLFTRCDFEH